MNVVTDNLDVFLEGMRRTVELSVLSFFFAFVVGVIVAALRVSPVPPLRWAAATYVELVPDPRTPGASASVPTTTVAVSHTFSQPPPPVGNDPNTGEPNLPCTPDIDGYLYLTTTADGADHKFVCGPDRAGKFRWIEIA